MSRTLYLCLVFLFIGAAFGFPSGDDEVVEEDDEKTDGKRVIGGGACEISKHPEICSLRVILEQNAYSFSFSQFCGATLIAPTWAVTAAHCVDAAFEAKVEAESKCYEHRVRDLDPDVSQAVCDMFITCGITTCDDIGTTYNVKKAFVHPGWPQKGVAAHDMACLQLTEPVIPTANIKFAKLCPSHSIDPASLGEGTIVGWGAVDPLDVKGSQSPYLKEALVKIHPIEICHQMFGRKIIPGTQICIGNRTQTSCGGDSGGPLFLDYMGNKCLRGATSFGGKICGDVPSVYADVMYYLPWIRNKINMHDPEDPSLQIIY